MTTRNAEPEGFAEEQGNGAGSVLTRGLLESGLLDTLVAADDPMARRVTEIERLASLRETLALRPDGDVWVFGYGSLVWNAAIDAVEKRLARVVGWHRAFCLSITALRATAEQPGLMLSLDRGGQSCGVAYRLAEDVVERELRLLWRREMVIAGYVPRWVPLVDAEGHDIGTAIAFTTDAAHPLYAGGLGETGIAHRLATAAGSLGSNAEYLDRTCDGLQAAGICDPALGRLKDEVRRIRRASRGRSATHVAS
ncbi:gamma-glutamylcyclotransferase [Roseateles chitinivorans]|uniref:gamma-glutamylcyclotransferase n=1 Tax=Roseateles chitinivorans TaxID=2917965 RepID=UPI003D674036